MVTRTVVSSTAAKKNTPMITPTMALGSRRTRVRQSGSRRYTHSAVMSPRISSSRSAAVDSLAGMASANAPAARVPAPGSAVLEKPTMSAPSTTSSQELVLSSGSRAARSDTVSEPISGRVRGAQGVRGPSSTFPRQGVRASGPLSILTGSTTLRAPEVR